MNDQPIDILHILWKGEIGGAERAIIQLVHQQMDDPQLAPAIAFGQSGGLYWEAANSLGCPIINLDIPSGFSVWKIPSIVSYLRPFRVHHFHSAELTIMIASLFCPNTWRVFTHRGGIFQYSKKKRYIYGVAGLFIRSFFKMVSGNTVQAARSAARLYHLPINRIQVTYNPIDFNLLKPENSKIRIQQYHGLFRFSTVLGTSANLRPLKRIERLIQLIADLKSNRIGLLIVGDGVDKNHLEKLAIELNVADRVIFTGKQPNIADYLQVMDIFCLPSGPEESFGNALIEAMGMAIPSIIFSDGGGMLDHIQNNETGFIVNNQQELCNRILYLADHPDFAKNIGQSGAKSVKEKYNPKQCAAKFRMLYPIDNIN